jgi:hypothetical protein
VFIFNRLFAAAILITLALTTLSADAVGPGVPVNPGGGGSHTTTTTTTTTTHTSTSQPSSQSAPASQNFSQPSTINEIDAVNQSAGAANNQHDSDTIDQLQGTPNNSSGNQPLNPSKQPSPLKPYTPSANNGKFKFSPQILITAPERALKATPGLIVGAPIATTKKIIEESKQATIDLAGSNRNPVILFLLAGFLGVPGGVLSGATEGPAVAAAHGWKYADQKPFSKEYFSLGQSTPLPPQ